MEMFVKNKLLNMYYVPNIQRNVFRGANNDIAGYTVIW